jgi:2-C-methyl-D-erythritol 2,4-cyclodiphosphate synthase
MLANIASDLQVAEVCINVKAKTAEGLGFVGWEEGVAADVVALIERDA